ncbi:hypothetical protein D3C71_961590 [compost metagenome]
MQALLHSAGKGGWQIVDTRRRDFDIGQPLLGGRADIAVVARARCHQPFADVPARRHLAAQAVHWMLMHHAPFRTQQAAALGFTHAVQGLILIQNLTVLRRQARGDGFEQGGFAGAGLADDPQHFARPQLERHVAKAFAGRIQMGQVVHRKQRFHWPFASLCWRQKSVSEQTNMRLPVSSSTTSSR